MARPRRGDRRVPVFPDDDRAWVWFLRDRFRLLDALVRECQSDPPSPELRRARFSRAVRHARRLLLVRVLVTTLLALGAVAAVSSAVFAYVTAPGVEAQADRADAFFQQAATWSGSFSVAFLMLRLALDRALERYDVVTLYLAPRRPG